MWLLALILAASPATLPEVQERLEKERNVARLLAARESSLLGKLADLERQIEVGARSLRAAELRLRGANARLQSAEENAQRAEAQLKLKTDVVGPRLLARYKLGREGYLRFLLGARSIGDVLHRKRLFDALLEADLDALADLRFQAQGAKAARDEFKSAKAELQASVQLEADRRASLEARIEQQRRVLVSVQQEKGAHDEAVRELEAASQSLNAKLGELSDKKPAMIAPEVRLDGPSIRKSRGKLLFPVPRGAIEVRFGRAVDPRFGTVTLQKGIDVRAETGSPVYAVWAGKVVHAGWFKGYGNLLIVDHRHGFFSLMAHLDTLDRAVGDILRKGDQIGTVGETGSLKGPYLYFELRDGQTPLDPERWFARRRKPPALIAGNKGSSP
jgi:septal ring factor EnvC (AmiA/AmiB activator)